MGQKSVGRLHRRLDVLQTSYQPSPSWIQDGDAGNDVIQDLGRVFRSLLRCAVQNGGPSASGRHLGWPHLRVPEMRSSKMATGSGRAAILHRAPQWGSKNPPYTTRVFNYNLTEKAPLFTRIILPTSSISQPSSNHVLIKILDFSEKQSTQSSHHHSSSPSPVYIASVYIAVAWYPIGATKNHVPAN